MKYGESLIITGAFECLCLVYLITTAALRSLTRFTTPRYESVISCPIPKFCAHESVPDPLWPSTCNQGGLLNISANRSFD